MTAREQADELKRQAIDLLLKERDAIDAELKALGYGQEKTAPQKRRGRPPKRQLSRLISAKTSRPSPRRKPSELHGPFDRNSRQSWDCVL